MTGPVSQARESRRIWPAVVLAAASALATAPDARGDGAVDDELFCLTVLHNNDGESQILNAGTGDLADFGGAAEFVTVVRQQRAAALREGCDTIEAFAQTDGSNRRRAVITVSSGDNFRPSPAFSASLETRHPPATPYFDSIVVSHVGYDALAIGNHEFDFGPDVLAAFIRGVDPATPFVSANLDFSAEPGFESLVETGRVRRSIVVKRAGRRIGIVGATTEILRTISSPRDVVVTDVRHAVQSEIDALTEDGVDIVVLISHLQSIIEDTNLIPQLSGVDIVIAGGGDEVLANAGDVMVPGDEGLAFRSYPFFATDADGREVPVVTTAGNYKYVGRLSCAFDPAGTVGDCAGGPVRVARIPAGGRGPADAVPPDAAVHADVTAPVAAFVDAFGSQIVGRAEVALDGRRGRVRTAETNLGNLVADAIFHAAEEAVRSDRPDLRPEVGLQNGGGIRSNDIRGPRDISKLDVFDILPFSNFVTVVPRVPRGQFKEILENAVARVEKVAGSFAQVSGFRFTWDPAGRPQVLDEAGGVQTAGTRVVSATLDDGTALVADGEVVGGPTLNVAIVDFLARGGDGYPFRGAGLTILGISYQQALQRFIADRLNGRITAEAYPDGGEGRIVRLPATAPTSN